MRRVTANEWSSLPRVIMKKLIVFCGVLSGLHMSVGHAAEPPMQEQELVTLRTARVLAKKQVDYINTDLFYLQHYHDVVYDALCLSLVIDPNKIVATSDASLLDSLKLIDENQRIKDAVEMVLEARLLDSNTHNPCPYEMLVLNQEIVGENGNEDHNPER
jgi:hypothetical protein